MRLGPTIRYAVPAAVVALLCAWAVWLALRPDRHAGRDHHGELSEPVPTVGQEAMEAQLRECIGRTGKEVVRQLALGEAQWSWTDEPPSVLRGISYFPADGRSVAVYLAEGEPWFRRFDERREWDYEGFLSCRVGGIQYEAGDVRLDIGSAVPWQWRQR